MSLAPYAAEQARQMGPHRDAPLAHMLTHPARDRTFAAYETMVGKCLAARGYRLQPQTCIARAAPYATRSDYLHDARDFHDTSAKLTDLRHMNADYGFALFRAFAELHPVLGCFIASTQTT